MVLAEGRVSVGFNSRPVGTGAVTPSNSLLTPRGRLSSGHAPGSSYKKNAIRAQGRRVHPETLRTYRTQDSQFSVHAPMMAMVGRYGRGGRSDPWERAGLQLPWPWWAMVALGNLTFGQSAYADAGDQTLASRSLVDPAGNVVADTAVSIVALPVDGVSWDRRIRSRS